ncbi:MAG: HAD family hydrolase [Elusimicrobiota bacterium]
MKQTILFLFDLDGTLVTTGGAGLRALGKVFQELYNIQDVWSSINPSGKTDHAIFREIIHKFLDRPMSDNEIKPIAEKYISYLDHEINSTPHHVKPLKGVIEFLDECKKKTHIFSALGTGNLEQGARIKLKPTGLNDYFELGGFGSDAEARYEVLKAGHAKVEEKLGATIHPDYVFVLGDTILDVSAARKAQFKAVAIASGGSSYAELERSKPDFLFQDMNDALKLLDAIDNLDTLTPA